MRHDAAIAVDATVESRGSVEPHVDLTILIPCLDEAETLAVCIEKGRRFLARSGLLGEILIADNGSIDGSVAIATELDARVVHVPERGYGSALRCGIAAAAGRFVVMGDADGSYDLSDLSAFLEALDAGADLVMGNRFRGGIASGAMPPLHRYLGNPVLSWLGRLFFRIPIGDFHCGLRAFRRDAVIGLDLRSGGMEFASEMVVQASLQGLRVAEVPTMLSKDGRSRRPHLRTWRDGWRHLRFLVLHSPRWAFGYPGAFCLVAGSILILSLLSGQRQIGFGLSLDIRAFLVGCMQIVIGVQAMTFGLIARRFAGRNMVLPRHRKFQKLLDAVTLERLLLAAGALGAAGACGFAFAVVAWASRDFGQLSDGRLLRDMLLSLTAVVTAVQLGFSGVLLGVLDLPAVAGDARSRLTLLRTHFPDLQ